MFFTNMERDSNSCDKIREHSFGKISCANSAQVMPNQAGSNDFFFLDPFKTDTFA